MNLKKMIIGLLLSSLFLFGLEYHTDGKPIYEPMDVTVTPMDGLTVYPMTSGETPITQNSVNLNDGWSLIGIDSDMDLDTLIDKIGDSNLQEIRGFSKSYKASRDNSSNDFTELEEGKGYWIKVAQGVSLYYAKVTYASNKIALKRGWNLINPLGELTLNEIISQIGDSTLEVIHGFSKTYQKKYVDDGMAFLNDFSKFEPTKGYWIKVNEDSLLSF